VKAIRSYFLVLAIATLPLGCDGVLDPPNGLEHSIAMPTCGPADEPYVSIYLTPEPTTDVGSPRAPYLHLNIPAGFTYLRDGQTFEIGDYPSGSNAWYTRDETSSFLLEASSGDIRISDVSSSEIEGTINLRFPNGARIRGSFEAPWRHRQTFCG
jgi:hypothetical protein